MIDYFYKRFVWIYVNSFITKKVSKPNNKIFKRVIRQNNNSPDFLQVSVKIVSILFLISFFFKKKILLRKNSEIISNARQSWFFIFRSLIRFHDSIYMISNNDEILSFKKIFNNDAPKNIVYDYIIVGSGPGGSVSGHELQKSGYKTCIIDSGGDFSKQKIIQFSYDEMIHMYKNSGISATLGNVNIAYVEGHTLGGGSEINSGLYHRAPRNILSYWSSKYGLEEINNYELNRFYRLIEKKLSISYLPPYSSMSLASLKLRDGAKSLNWSVEEIPRWVKYGKNAREKVTRMSMMNSYLKEYKINGGEVYSYHKALDIKRNNNIWNINVLSKKGKKNLSAKNIILSAGAIGTPKILLRSGISKNVGKNLQMHPTLKVVALFKEKVNSKNMIVPVHQVKEFSPDYTFGCSISSKQYLKLAMLDHYKNSKIIESSWEHMAIYYIMITPEGVGKLNNYPFFSDFVLRYNLTKVDKKKLATGLRKLCNLLLNAGAISLFPSINRSSIIRKSSDLNLLPKIISPKNSSIMTVHLFSSCPAGENLKKCVTNSFGQVHGHKNLFIADSSILPSAPSVNPQGTIMALAHRNIEKIINKK